MSSTPAPAAAPPAGQETKSGSAQASTPGETRRSSRERSRRSRSRSRSRSSDRNNRRSSHSTSSRRHRRRRSRSSSRSRTPSRSRSRSPKSKKRERRRRRSPSSSRSRSRSRSYERRHNKRTSRRSRSRSHSQRRKSRSRERRERNQTMLPAGAHPAAPNVPSANGSHAASEPRRPNIVTRDQRDHQQHNHHNGGGGGNMHRGGDHHGGGGMHRSNDPLSRRPPPPPFERPASLLTHVLPSSVGKYAYVMLVMKGDSYACGAIIAAYSLKKAGTKHSLVCMVTPDVTEACRRRMLHVFTEVVEVPYVQFEVKPLRTQKQRNMYNSWVDAAFTKWNMLTLVQYEKTLFVDADKICISNMDHLFEEMHTPAGTFSSPWSQPFVGRKDQISQRKGQGSQRGRYSNSAGMLNPYQHCGHDARVTSSMVYTALTEQSFVVIGTVVLLSPSLEDYAQYKAMLATLVPFGFSDCHSMMDEQSLSYYFSIYKNQLIQQGTYGQLTGGKAQPQAADGSSAAAATASSSSSSAPPAAATAAVTPFLPTSAVSEWSYIHHMYNYVPWHRYWLIDDEVPYTFHFFNTKPWVLDRAAWLDLEAWWELVLSMCSDSSLTEEQRDDLRSIYPAAMREAPKNEGCAWCRLSEESFMATQDGSWKKHNVFDSHGQLQCPAMKAGFDKWAQKRLTSPSKPHELRAVANTAN